MNIINSLFAIRPPMAKSREMEINHFMEVTGCNNQEDAIRYMDTYEWDIEWAIEGYLQSQQNGTESDEEHVSLSNSSNEHSDGSSSNLYNSSRPTTDSSNGSEHISTRASFIDHGNQLTVSCAPTDSPIFPSMNQYHNNKQQLSKYIDKDIIGKNKRIQTPWGLVNIVYADYTASGRALRMVEQYIIENVLPFYANTHSENNACAAETTRHRETARKLIKQYVNATDDDALIFVGSGSTAAINKLVRVLQLDKEEVRNRTVVFISSFEHHSNILPWRETGVEVVRIPHKADGLLDRDYLEQKLKEYYNQKHIICTFSAASNVTGILTDVDNTSALVHQYNGWIFWDYAAGAPYLHIDMNRSTTAYKDAVFISTHKFIGGPQTPGILIAKKSLFTNKIPVNCGGGTVNFVTRRKTEYSKDIEVREEGGTPEIVGSIRASLVFHIKQMVGHRFIEQREEELVEKFLRRFRDQKNLQLLGSSTAPRLAIFSFLIYVPAFKKYLHHNFICVLLNDLFGIQVRSGCSCAGPYVIELLGIDDDTADIFTEFITENRDDQTNSVPHNALMKPGFARFNLSYFASDEEVDYILNAMDFIAKYGWMFLSLYTYNPDHATWCPRQILSQNAIEHPTTLGSLLATTSDNPFERAQSIVPRIPQYVYNNIDRNPTDPPLNIPEKHKHLLWFVTPIQSISKIVYDYDTNQSDNQNGALFNPK